MVPVALLFLVSGAYMIVAGVLWGASVGDSVVCVALGALFMLAGGDLLCEERQRRRAYRKAGVRRPY
ncbi:MAG: hypothetical protein ABSB73_12970 [Solirubrobacteraceae bacterium]|jgi:hypothetical protein